MKIFYNFSYNYQVLKKYILNSKEDNSEIINYRLLINLNFI